ncbi:MAG: SAM-dependent methyltransferase [Acidobacteria bacterium]|nr:MAG: SAM-dependent methyltransferase [Acidobacteriota bacterium]
MTSGPAKKLYLRRIAAVLSLSLVFFQPARPLAQNAGQERDAWQRPEEVMDALGIKPGSVVADVGCGAGYFTFHLAERVGPKGKVYAEDIREDRLAGIRKRAQKEGVTNIETVSGAEDDPRLPLASVDVVMIVDAFHEMRHYDAMLEAVFRALKPGGLLALIDGAAEPGRPRDEYYERHRMPEQTEREDAERNGFRFVRDQPGFTRADDKKEYYFVIFEKPGAPK